MAKGYIPLFFDTLDGTKELTDEEFGRLIRAAGSYAMGLDDYADKITGNERYAFPFLKGQIDRNDEISKARALARAGKSKQSESNDIKTEQMISNDNKPEQTGSNSLKEKEKEKEKGNKKENKRFSPPTQEEVAEYCRERGNNVNPQRFIDFYESKGWRVGAQPMKDWKAAVRTWEQRNQQSSVIPIKPTAQAYSQRSYSGEQDEAMRRMIEQMGVSS